MRRQSNVDNAAGRKSSVDAQAADSALAKMGYKAELPRSLSMLSVLGLSFAIMAVPYGLSTTFYYTLINGQSVTIIWGWVLLSFLSTAIAASLAEICSVYPTAGGVYYWAALLSTPKYAPIASYVTGWLTLTGNWTVTLSINFGGAQLILSAINLWNPDFVAQPYQTVLMFWCVMLICAAVNIFLSKYLDFINKLCIYWTGATILIILIVLSTLAKAGRHDAKYVFAHYDTSASGWPTGWSFFVGLLQPSYVLTGYGMVASLSEEVQNPEREVPKAIVLSVVAAGFTGVIYLLPILFTLPNIEDLLAVVSGQPIGLLFQTVTGSAAGGFGLLFLILGVWLFAGIGALTAASRCTYAFARDGAIPGSFLWKRVDKRFNIPLWGLILSTAVDCVLGLIYFGSTAAFNSFTGVATICLSASYGLPILVLVLRRRKAVKHASFSLGKFGYFINIITICWIILAIFIFCMPVTRIDLTPVNMNYASVVFSVFAATAVVWYFVWGRRNFSGPAVLKDLMADTDGVIKGEALNDHIAREEAAIEQETEKKF